MSINNLQQIFQHYINRFDFINNNEHQEYYKWQVCHEYPILMSKALASSDDDFSKALYEVKKCTHNIIDSYTQPFSGLVEYAKYEPDSVRNMFKDLYSDDGGDLKIQMEKISDFFKRSNSLIEKYNPGSFLYKQNSHSVSAYLFSNDPEHHYMYKATQSKNFADCIEFYDDWGNGDNIKLDTYYRMCDELVAAIKECPELLQTDSSRFDGRLKLTGGELHPDIEKHILAFDIIYCCTAYDLFDGISFPKRNMKEKQLYLAEKAKAQSLKEEYDKAEKNYELLKEALVCFINMIPKGGKVIHKKYGEGIIESIDEKYVVASYSEKQVRISLPIGIANNLIRLDTPDFDEKVAQYREVLKKHDSIPNTLDYAVRALEPYEEYLE